MRIPEALLGEVGECRGVRLAELVNCHVRSLIIAVMTDQLQNPQMVSDLPRGLGIDFIFTYWSRITDLTAILWPDLVDHNAFSILPF